MENTDRTIVGAFAGIIGGISLTLYLYLLGLFLPAAPKTILSVGSLFIHKNQIDSLWGQVIAHIAHLVVSALLGIIFINIFRLTGKDWVTTKGVIFGLAVWVILSGGAANLLGLMAKKPSLSIAMVLITAHILFGIMTAWSSLVLSNKNKL